MATISKIRSNGFITGRPGVYLEEEDVSADQERPLSLGKYLGLVGPFNFLEGAKVHEFTSGQGMRKTCSKSTLLRKLTNVSFAPSTNLNGAPEKVLMGTTMTTTQATRTLADASTHASVKLLSDLWGPWGNRVLVGCAANADDSTLRDFVIARDGITETYVGLGSGPLIKLYYVAASGVATTVEVAYDPTVGLTLISKYATLAAGGALTEAQCAKILTGGVIKGTPSGAQTSSNTGTLTVVGYNSAGAAKTGTAVWNAGAGTTKTTVQSSSTDVEWGTVTSVAWASEESGITMALEFHKVFAASEFNSWSDIVSFITNYGNGYNVVESSALAVVARLEDADAVSQVALGVNEGAAISIRADVWSIVRSINAESSLVTAEVATTNVATRAVPAAYSGYQQLAGGSATGGTTADEFETALLYFRNKPRAHILWPYTTDADAHKKLKTHISYMMGPGRGPCYGWVGGGSLETRAQLKARTVALNTPYLSLTGQDVEFQTDIGPEWHGPEWAALYGAAMQAIVGVAEPLSNDYSLDIERVRSGFDFDTEVEGLIEDRVSLIAPFDAGYKWERPLTTCHSSGEPDQTEASARESSFMSIRDVQEALESNGIQTNAQAFANETGVVSITKSRLRLQLKAGWIKDADFKSVTLRAEGGDRVSDGWDYIPTIPINFVGLRPRIRRGVVNFT